MVNVLKMKRMIITPAQLNEIVTADYDMKNLKKVQREIYNSVSDYCGKMHSDDAWQDVKTLIGMIRGVEGVEDIHVGAGEYSNYLNPENGACRDYETTVVTSFGKLYGYIRCHAAGTTDDIFKYYDMTISLYPDKKRDMEERLEEMNEASVLTNAKSAAPADITAAVNNVVGKTNSNTVQVGIPGNTGLTQATTLPSLETGGEKIDPNASSVSVTIDPTKNVTESRKYSKRQVELGRMLEMRKRGKVYSKKRLNEMFMDDADDIETEIKGLPAFNVMTTVRCAFGPEAEKEMMEIFSNGKNPTEFIVNLYKNASPEDKRVFRERLGI